MLGSVVGTIEREKAAIGVFITLETPTRDMNTEALSAGTYQSALYGTTHRKIQILTIADLLSGQRIDMPPQHGTFKQAGRAQSKSGEQLGLFENN
jgi:hypothetical protein